VHINFLNFRWVITPNSLAGGGASLRHPKPTDICPKRSLVKRRLWWVTDAAADLCFGGVAQLDVTTLRMYFSYANVRHATVTPKHSNIFSQSSILSVTTQTECGILAFDQIPKSATLNDLERLNGRHFASFHTQWQLSEPTVSNSLKL